MAVQPADRALMARNRLRHLGIRFGDTDDVPWRVASDRHLLTTKQTHELVQLGQDCSVLMECVRRLVVTQHPVGGEICKRMGTDMRRVRLALTCDPFAPIAPMIRPDTFWDTEGNLRVVEIETMIGGLGIGHAMRHAYAGGTLPGIAKGYAEMMWSLHAANGRTPTNLGVLTIAVVVPESKAGYDPELEILATALLPHYVRLVLVRPNEIHIQGSKVLAAGEPIDLIHRFFRVSEFDEDRESLATLMLIHDHQLVPMVLPWFELLEEKGLFALVHREELASFWEDQLGIDCFTRLRAIFPRTWFLDDPKISEMLAACRTGTKHDRDIWLKRSGGTWGGRGTFYGKGMTNTKWRPILEGAIDESREGTCWVLQEHRECAPLHVRYVEPGETQIQESDQRLRVCPYYMRDGAGNMQMVEVVITARREYKVHGARNAAMLLAEVA